MGVASTKKLSALTTNDFLTLTVYRIQIDLIEKEKRNRTRDNLVDAI